MTKNIKETQVQEQNPQGGGSYVRNEDGSLALNQADLQKTNPANDAAGTDIPKE